MKGLYMIKKSIAVLVLICITPFTSAQSQSFKDFIQTIQQEAQAEGVSASTINILSKQSKPFKKMGIRQQVNVAEPISFGDYLTSTVTSEQLQQLENLHAKYQKQLTNISKYYKVQPRFVLAAWAVVSDIGQSNSSFPVLSIYSSKAFASDKTAARTEIFAALKAIDAKKIDAQDFKADHQGRIGQLSFTPKLYADYAQDWDGDGKFDIWHNNLDSLATVAHFLAENGWLRSQTWGRQVALQSKTLSKDLYGKAQTFSYWSNKGVTKYNGSPLSSRADIKSTLVQPLAKDKRHYLVYRNFDILTLLPEVDNKKALAITYLSEKLKPIIRKK